LRNHPRKSFSVFTCSTQLSARWPRWAISRICEDRRLVAVLLVTGLLYSLGHAASALVVGILAGKIAVLGPHTQQVVWPVITLCLLGVAAVCVKSFGAIGLARAQALASGVVGMTLRDRIASVLIASGTARPAPDALASVALGVREIETAFVLGVLTQMRAVAQLVPLAGALIFVSPRLAIGGAVAMLSFGAALAAVRHRWRSASASAHALAEQLHSGVDELVGNLDLWRTYGAGSSIRGAIRTAGQRAVSAMLRVESSRAALSSGNELLGALVLLAILLGDGKLVEFSAVFFMSYRPLRDLGDARAALGRGHAAASSLERLVGRRAWTAEWDADAPSEVPSDSPSHALEILRVDAVGLQRGGPRTSFELAAGTMVAVVGPTGSGKTSLLRALLGLEPAVGRVTYGGQALADAVGPHARPLGWVPQEAPLVTGTLFANLTLFGASESAARQALREVGGAELERRIGVSVVGPGGRPLSGGERRQVALARGWASGLPVLLIDEPTEGLDEQSAGQVIAALTRARGRRSLVVVTHRAEVWSVADQIVPIGNADRDGTSAVRGEGVLHGAARQLYAGPGGE
jgi:ABC-type transport system involved in cytochrome bd biosynthesis fused ATPase/permease subunit